MAPANGDRYRWEDSPGLSHHCGVCHTPLSNPHALQSCIGEHVEPCQRFHQQLHFIRKSHDCMSCANGVEMHRKRHREILTAVHLVNEESGEAVTSPPEVASMSSTTKKERKQIRKSAANSARIPAAEIFTEADYVFVSEALYGKTTWGKSGNPKDENAASQSSKQTDTRSASTARDERKLSRTEIFIKRLRKASGRSSSSPAPVNSDPLLGVDRKIFERLGVNLDGYTKWSKGRKEELKKLATIIAQDLEITEKEEREVEIRKAGFYRFINKRIAVNLEELHKKFSWATGEKKD